MDLYSKKSRWKIYLAIAGIVILLVSLFYTQFLARHLVEEVKYKAELMGIAQTKITEDFDPNDPCEPCKDVTIYGQIIEKNQSIPILLVEDGKVQEGGWIGFNTDDTAVLNRELEKMIRKGVQPIIDVNSGVAIYYKDPPILDQLRYFPIIQLLLIAAFIFFGYLSFSTARRAEQNRVWVGMAKETAHQLGTPISGMVAWIEHLRLMKDGDEEVNEVLDELGKDVNRLELIADRFSKIGSEPKLTAVNIFDELESSRAYMQRRAPRKVQFDFPDPTMPTGNRNSTVVAPQALLMMNSDLVMDSAEQLADQLLALECEDAERIVRLYQRSLGRSPTTIEVDRALAFVTDMTSRAFTRSDSIDQQQQRQAWSLLCQSLFASNEFIYVR